MSNEHLTVFKGNMASPTENTARCALTICDLWSETGPHPEPYVTPVTEFHIQLTRGNLSFTEEVIRKIPEPEAVTFVLRALVDFKLPRRQYATQTNQEDKNLPDVRLRESVTRKETAQCGCFISIEGISRCPPLVLAMSSGNKDLVRLLLRLGVDLHQKADRGWNVVHFLVALSDRNLEPALTMYSLLVEHCQVADLRRLLGDQNEAGLVPLDMAADRALPEMLLSIFSTDGVYRFPVKDCGTHEHVLYDISDYEGEHHKQISLLGYISAVHEKYLTRLENSGLFQKGPIAAWIKVKCRTCTAELSVYASVWCLYLSLYLGYLYYFVHGKASHPIYLVLLLFVSIWNLVIIIVSYSALPKLTYIRLRNIAKGRYPATLTGLSHLFLSIFIVNVSALCCCSLMGVSAQENPFLHTQMHAVTSSLGIASVVFLLQINASVGYLINVVITMTVAATIFCTLAFFAVIAFATGLYLVHLKPFCHLQSPHIDTAQEGCFNGTRGSDNKGETFTSIGDALYQIVLLCLPIMAPKALFFENANTTSIAMFLYITGLLFLSIVGLNLLIAIMTQRVQEIHAHKDSIIALQQLSIALFVRRLEATRLNWLTEFGKRVCKFQCLNVLRMYVYSFDRKTVYLPVKELTSNGMLHEATAMTDNL